MAPSNTKSKWSFIWSYVLEETNCYILPLLFYFRNKGTKHNSLLFLAKAIVVVCCLSEVHTDSVSVAQAVCGQQVEQACVRDSPPATSLNVLYIGQIWCRVMHSFRSTWTLGHPNWGWGSGAHIFQHMPAYKWGSRRAALFFFKPLLIITYHYIMPFKPRAFQE